MVVKKLEKGKDIQQIAEEIEETPEMVKKICTAVTNAGTDDVEKIYESWKALEK